MRIKKLIVLNLFFVLCLLASCKKTVDYSKIKTTAPELRQLPGKYEIDFLEMHNYVIDSLQSETTPFFYIVNGKFDISGDNEKKEIVVKCTCLDGCVQDDVDLFFSYVLNLMSINASEQDYKYKAPTMSDDGTYTDFGTVFNSFNLRLFADKESGGILRDTYIVKGEKIPIDPRYIKET